MQTYLPHKNFRKCAEVLDDTLLLRQRKNAQELIDFILWKVNATEVKPKKDLTMHPIFQYWWNKGAPFIKPLYRYLEALNFECFNRKFKKVELRKYIKMIDNIPKSIHIDGRIPTPTRITRGYRIVLLCLNEEFYKEHFYVTYLKFKKDIDKLKKSKEEFKFAKYMGLHR